MQKAQTLVILHTSFAQLIKQHSCLNKYTVQTEHSIGINGALMHETYLGIQKNVFL